MLISLAVAMIAYDAADRFRAEYPVEVAALKREFVDMSGVGQLRQGGLVLGPPTRIEFATGPDRAKFEVDLSITRPPLKADPVRLVHCREGTRCFQLQSRGGAKSFAITSLGDDPMSRGIFDTTFGKYLIAPWAVSNIDLTERLSSRPYRIIEGREFTEGGRELVELSFEVGDPAERLDSLRVTFEPKLHWAIVRSEDRQGFAGGRVFARAEVSYATHPTGRFYPRTVRMTDIAGLETICDFDPVAFAPIPASDFTLEHYGLENPRPKQRPRSVAFWLLAALFTGVALLFVGRWMYRGSSRVEGPL